MVFFFRGRERSGLRRKREEGRCCWETKEIKKTLVPRFLTHRFDEDRREDDSIARDAGRRVEAAAAAAVAAKPRGNAKEADADTGNADAATFLAAAASDAAATTGPLFARRAAEAAPALDAPMCAMAMAARVATGAALRDAKREPGRKRGIEGRRWGEWMSKKKSTKDEIKRFPLVLPASLSID